jgi:predicted nucleotidyltransferase
VRVFGSMVRGESDASSDVASWSRWNRAQPYRPRRAVAGLGGHAGTHVDVLGDGGVSPHLRERIYAEAVSL